MLQHFKAIGAGHVQIKQNDIECLFPQQSNGTLPAIGSRYVMVTHAQQLAQCGEHAWLIVDH